MTVNEATEIPNGAMVRFNAKVDRRGPDECWPWMGARDSKGYGTISVEGKATRVSHVALAASGRPRPSPAHYACHTCDNPPCVNPTHLWWGSQRENIQDASRKGRLASPIKDICSNGHLKAGDNLVIRANGQRWCRACAALWMREHRRRARAGKPCSFCGCSSPNHSATCRVTRKFATLAKGSAL